MNIAQRCINRYESKDFKDEYSTLLFERFGDNEGDIINRIIDLFNVSNYETEKYLTNWKVISREQAKLICEFISNNLESFQRDYNGYYVGYTSLESVEFSEQEEQLTGIYNHKTGKDYSIKYLRSIFRKEDFCINESSPNYAYYIVSGGLRIDLLQGKDLLNEFLLTI